MVKVVFALLLCSSFAFSSALSVARSFVDSSTYNGKRNLINALFSKSNKYIKSSTDEVDTIKILKELKANGLLTLFYENPVESVIRFDTKGNPLLALRIINDTLEDLGFNDYITKSISKHEDSLSWSIALTANSIVNPVDFVNRMKNLGSIINRVQRSGEFYWSYKINLSQAKLKTIPILLNRTKVLKKPNRPYWFMVYGIKNASFSANGADNWFAKIVFYDKYLHPLLEIKSDEKKKALNINIPKDAFYMEVGDLYRLENIRRGLTLILR